MQAIGPLLITIGEAFYRDWCTVEDGSCNIRVIDCLSASGGPLFLTALAVGVLGGAFIASRDNMVNYYEEVRELTETEKENKEKVEELKDAYDELSQHRQESVSVIEAQSGKRRSCGRNYKISQREWKNQ